MKFDIAIIGGGPAGYNAGERAAENGLKAVLFEKKAVGGVCLNEGCIPTKTLLYSAKTLDSAKTAAKYGINIEGTPSFDLAKIMTRKDNTVKKLTMGVQMKLKSNGVTIVENEAIIKGEKDGYIQIESGKETYSVKYLLVCAGSETFIPPIKGLSDVKYWTSREALQITSLPKSIAIIGGGVIGIEFASFFNSMGVKVTVIEMMSEILGAMDNEISAMLRTDYTKKGIKFYLEAKVVEVAEDKVIIEKKGKTETIPTDQILVSVGRRPSTKDLGLETLNIELDRNAVKVNKYLQTSHPQVYACGDINGVSLLAHTAIRESDVAVNHIIGIEDEMNYNAIPGVVYTNPEVAGVGKTEEELKTAGQFYSVLKLPMAYSGRFVAENEGGNGICKLIIDAHKKIIGCHMLGNPVSELIVLASVAINEGFTVEEFQKQIFPHPTVGEILRETLFS